jgi:peptidoglycan/xylan/chitin deacetylase (PgdA/CDA1 family)
MAVSGPPATRALRLDDVGAASKRHEVYGMTRIRLGGLALPFPGNFLFLKYVPPVKRWGPYRELRPAEWERILEALEATGARMSVGVTAGWVESDGRVVPFPAKFPDVAALIRCGVDRGLLEVANHGYTHCVLEDHRFRPRLFSGNRAEHREFHAWLPAAVHRDHVERAQGILQGFLGSPVVTFVPPGNVFTRDTLIAAAAAGLRYVSCLEPERWGPVDGLVWVGGSDVVAIHDRDLVVRGLGVLDDLLEAGRPRPFVTVREMGDRLERTRR